MLAYIFRRLLLIIPTLLGILVVNFIIIQAAPGGPVEQMIAKLEGFDAAAGGATGVFPVADQKSPVALQPTIEAHKV